MKKTAKFSIVTFLGASVAASLIALSASPAAAKAPAPSDEFTIQCKAPSHYCPDLGCKPAGYKCW